VPAPPGVTCSERARVTEVVDGDTIDVAFDGGRDTVRYIGVDTPEGGQPFSTEAADANARLVAGQTLCLEKDITDRDRFGRLLRYAWNADGTLVNEALLAEGVASISTFPPDVKYVDSRYRPAQDAAQAAGRGIWASAAAGDCDAAYPTVCIPPPPPDLDCGDITFRRFQVLPPDPHRFDLGDGDGIGCETG
jgi:micrococcal nuclease